MNAPTETAAPVAVLQELAASAERGPEILLRALVERYGRGLKLASSLGAEDQVLTHMLLQIDPRARIFVLDTGRLHQETYDLMARTMSRYDMRYEVLFPAAQAVQEMVAGGRSQPVLRQRRGAPALLRGAQGGAAGPGARRCRGLGDRAAPRAEPGARRDSGGGVGRRPRGGEGQPAGGVERGAGVGLPARPRVPYNVLHDQGFLSIGCAPCTRAVEPGEPARAGRWWWEQGTAKECGLHPAGEERP